MGKTSTHCPQGHEYTEENTRWRTTKRLRADGTPTRSKSCKRCEKDYVEQNRTVINERNKRYYDEDPERRNAQVSRSSKKRLKEIRSEVIEAYGSCCACCGESTPEFLHLDHVNNDGAEHRREITGGRRGTGGSLKMLVWAKQNNWPDRLQLLCHNCGMAQAWYGQCPHELEAA